MVNLDKLQEHEDHLQKGIFEITTSKLDKLFKDASLLNMDAISHKLCLLRRLDKNDVHSKSDVTPMTHSIQSRLANQYRNLERAERVHLYKMFGKVRDSRLLAGVFFEAIAQEHFQEGGTKLTLIPMVRLKKSERSGGKKRPPQLQWYSSHITLRNTSLEIFRQEALTQQFTVEIKPSETIEYTEDSIPSIKSNIFYVPELNNQKAFDSFIMLDGFLYIFQFTIASTHDINHGLIDFAINHGFPPIDKWRFVFVIPHNLTMTSPQPSRPFPKELHPFSATFDHDSIGWVHV